MSCPLCRRELITELLYEDGIVWVVYCKSHPSKVMIVLKRHTKEPSMKEWIHILQVVKEKFPYKKFRDPRSILDHFHWHEV